MNSLPPSISVVIPTRNRGSAVTNGIASILKTLHTDSEVILVDQSTNSETRTAVQQFCVDPRFRYIPSPTTGVGLGRNIGMMATQADIVIFTDDDCRVPAGWIDKMVEVFLLYPQVTVVFSNVIPGEHDSTKGFIPGYYFKKSRLVKSMRDKCTARGIGASMGVRREEILKIGGFDIALGPGARFTACEEGDLAVRALLAGQLVFETADTYVIHDGYRTWEQGKALAKRNWTGIGAAYAKPLRCGYLSILPVILYESFVIALLTPLREIIFLRKTSSIKGFVYFWIGFINGWKNPIDCRTITYVNPSTTTDSPQS
jgi:GT2 family glycosyltransferase